MVLEKDKDQQKTLHVKRESFFDADAFVTFIRLCCYLFIILKVNVKYAKTGVEDLIKEIELGCFGIFNNDRQ